jgi:hypothetical protein
MTGHESQIVKRALSHASNEVRAAQRCVEVLANLFEDMRRELYPHQASRIWYVLNQISNLERTPMYPLEVLNQSDKGWKDDRNVRYRWHFIDHAMPMFDLRSLADQMDELSELLSGVKIEDVAQSNGVGVKLASHLRYYDPDAEFKFGMTGFRELEVGGVSGYLEEMLNHPLTPIPASCEPLKNLEIEKMAEAEE